MTSPVYNGPAGMVFTTEELLIIWAYLSRIPTIENEPLRGRIRRYLEDHEQLPVIDVTGNAQEGGDA